ncbi:MAG: prephenate dehydrogenase/arogenate dehydrogenase family protein [Gammaproteobacteria bacterium]|nr:prephenate dehydrogenase/arogenate dehydrogenase family protein [Gammaproteobacteria bacterium]
MKPFFNRVAMIGVGLIGGSLARGLKKHGLCNTITGYARSVQELEKAVELGVIDDYASSVKDTVKNADLIILAIPMSAFESVFNEMSASIGSETLITDVGSAKASVIEAAKKAFGKLPSGLVPGHPIAGTEKSGVEASFDGLFENRRVILTPTENSSENAVEQVRQMWQQVGAEVVLMTADHHDQVLAATSHLPHVLAFSLVETLGKMHESSEIFRYAAGGFRDFTRIASSDPTMWRDICLHNKSAILSVLKKYERHLKTLELAIEAQDEQAINDIFVRAKAARDENVVD